jgi:hypothetical protein
MVNLTRYESLKRVGYLQNNDVKNYYDKKGVCYDNYSKQL